MNAKLTATESMEPTGCAVCGAALTQEHVGAHRKNLTAERAKQLADAPRLMREKMKFTDNDLMRIRFEYDLWPVDKIEALIERLKAAEAVCKAWPDAPMMQEAIKAWREIIS